MACRSGTASTASSTASPKSSLPALPAVACPLPNAFLLSLCSFYSLLDAPLLDALPLTTLPSPCFSPPLLPLSAAF